MYIKFMYQLLNYNVLVVPGMISKNGGGFFLFLNFLFKLVVEENKLTLTLIEKSVCTHMSSHSGLPLHNPPLERGYDG